MSLRQSIIEATELALKEIRDPKPILVTREPFEVAELAITQFPALLVQFLEENRETITMGLPGIGRRSGSIQIEIRGFVRGTEIDRRRTDLITAIEEALDADRYLGLKSSGVMDSQVITLQTVNRLAPLGEIRVIYRVDYNYERGSL